MAGRCAHTVWKFTQNNDQKVLSKLRIFHMKSERLYPSLFRQCTTMDKRKGIQQWITGIR